MIGSVTEYQEEARRAELAKRAAAIPKPDAAQMSAAKDILQRGYQSAATDRMEAARVLQAGGVDPAPYDVARHDDTVPPGFREIAAAVVERERGDGDADVTKTYADRGIACGPGEPMEPSAPRESGTFAREYIDRDHAAPSPQAEAPTANPRPAWPAGVPVPVRLGDISAVVHVPDALARHLSLGSPSER